MTPPKQRRRPPPEDDAPREVLALESIAESLSILALSAAVRDTEPLDGVDLRFQGEKFYGSSEVMEAAQRRLVVHVEQAVASRYAQRIARKAARR